tara:strand:- start:636 stop:944 length:309 start_codon:yes stop_codon:yes gene_type:complete
METVSLEIVILGLGTVLMVMFVFKKYVKKMGGTLMDVQTITLVIIVQLAIIMMETVIIQLAVDAWSQGLVIMIILLPYLVMIAVIMKVAEEEREVKIPHLTV